MASMTTSQHIVDILVDWGVERIFGIPGDGINGFMEALRQNQDKIEFVQTRHEEAAAFMACAHAKFTGNLGVCMATSGPGGIHLLNGLYDAQMDGQPVLAITGNTYHDLIDTHGQQDVRLERLFDDVAGYNTRLTGPAHTGPAFNMACRKALANRGVSHVTIPKDLQDLETDERSMRNVPGHSSTTYDDYEVVPSNGALRDAAAILNRSERIAMLVGRGAFGAREELIEVSDMLGAPIAKALLGKSVIPDHDPHTTGSIGLLGTAPSQEIMEECDTLFMVGTSFPYMEYLPEPGSARCVQIDIDPSRIGLRYPVDVGLVGGAKNTLRELSRYLDKRDKREFLLRANRKTNEWWESMRERGTSDDMPMKPQVVAWELGKRIDDDCLFTCDSGTIATWWARQIPSKPNQMHTVSGNLATMACGFPYAIAAQMAYPDRQCVAFVGDGGFSMLMPELATCKKYDLPVKVVVIKNDTLGQIKWEQMVMDGNPEYGCDLEPIDFAAAARSYGVAGFSVDSPGEVGEVLSEALSIDGPAVVEAVVDPFTPPLPPKIKWSQAKGFAKALARGEPHPLRQSLTAISDKVREMI